jgi:hypothetical protein
LTVPGFEARLIDRPVRGQALLPLSYPDIYTWAVKHFIFQNLYLQLDLGLMGSKEYNLYSATKVIMIIGHLEISFLIFPPIFPEAVSLR